MSDLLKRRRVLRLLTLPALLTASVPACAGLHKIRRSGSLKVAVYSSFAPFSDKGAGIDVDLAGALAKKLGLTLSLLPFEAGEDLNDDLRNMVWKGHYLGYGPADVLMHVPVDRQLMAGNPKVEIFAPYYRDNVKLARNTRTVPQFDGLESLADKTIGVEKVSIAGMLLLGADDGRYRDNVRIFQTATDALEKLKASEIDAVLGNQSELESGLKDENGFKLHDLAFPRMPRQGWVVGMAVKKDNTELARQLQAAMNDMMASGELAEIFGKYGVRAVKP